MNSSITPVFSTWSLLSLKPSHFSSWNRRQEWASKQGFFSLFLIQKLLLVSDVQCFSKTVSLYSSSSENGFHFQRLRIAVIPRKVQCTTLLSVVRLSKNWMWSNHMIHCNSAYHQLKTLGSQASKQGTESLKVLLTYFFDSNLLWNSIGSHFCLTNQTWIPVK